MLEGSLYTFTSLNILEVNSIYTLDIYLNKQNAIFLGHFPGRPVLPGVCMVSMVKDALPHLGIGSYGLKLATSIKFLNTINPNAVAVLKIEVKLISKEGEKIKVEAKIYSIDTLFFKMTGTFEQLK